MSRMDVTLTLMPAELQATSCHSARGEETWGEGKRGEEGRIRGEEGSGRGEGQGRMSKGGWGWGAQAAFPGPPVLRAPLGLKGNFRNGFHVSPRPPALPNRAPHPVPLN